MITTTYNYSSGTGFVYDSSKIGFMSSMAQLLLNNNVGQTFVPTISAAAYNPALLEFASSVLRQKDQRPANATWYASWLSSINANWSGPGNGSLVVTPFNGAAQSGGVLNLTGATNKYVTFDPINNTDTLNLGTIEFQYIPNYSGTPASPQIMFNASTAFGVINNLVDVEHVNNGLLYFQVFDSAGVSFTATTVFNPTAGQTYLIRCTFDASTGDLYIYIDGVEAAHVTLGAITRSGPIGYGVIGKYYTGVSSNADFSIKNLTYYSTITAPSTPTHAQTIYLDATAELPAFTYAGIGNVVGFTAFAATDSGSPRYVLNDLYWNGSAWVSSNGSYGQATSAATVNANIATLPASNALQVDVVYQGQNSQASIGALTVTYTGQIYPTSNPSIAPSSPIAMDLLSDFVAVLSASGSDGIKFYLKIGAINYWFNGSAWAASNGSYAQSNTAEDVQTNAATLPINLGAYMTPYALLHSGDGSTTPMLTSLTLTYSFFGPVPGGPNVCTVYGYLYDENKLPLNNATVAVTNPITFINQGVVIAQGVRSTRTDSIGYFEIDLVETATLLGENPLTFDVTYTQAQVGAGFSPLTYSFGSADIPDAPSANITDLVFV